MSFWKVSSRLYLIVGLSALVMIVLATVNWISLSHLSQLQDVAFNKTHQASELRHSAGLGADAYRIVADTFINRQFDESQKKWDAMTGEIDKALEQASTVTDTEDKRAAVQAGREAITSLRALYRDSYLPLAKRDAPRAEIAEVDDKIDKLIDKYDESFSKVASLLVAEATRADEAFDAAAHTTRIISVSSVLLGGLLLVAVALAISRSITRQLGMELGEATALAHRIAQGDLSHAFAAGNQDKDSLANALDDMLSTLKSIVTQVRQGSNGVATASAEIAQGNHDLSARTESQASALEQTAASMEQLGSTVRQNADSARQANQLALNASAVAVRGGEVVTQVVQTMTGINASSRKISDIISVIDGIAFQTNILALNAAVEAARAGEQGRGFAVVATEVRSLAGRSADAAKEIKSLINASVERVEQGTALVDQAGTTMTEVVGSIKRLTDIMGEISAASNEQALGVAQVGEAVTQMDQVTQQNAALVEEMAAAASGLEKQATDLVQVVATFRLADDQNARPHHSTVVRAAPALKVTPPVRAKPRPAAASSLGSSSKTPPKLAAAPALAPASGEGDWESF